MGEVRRHVGRRERALSVRFALPLAGVALACGAAGAQAPHESHAEHDAQHAEHIARLPSAPLPARAVTDAGTFALSLETSPSPIRLNEYFELTVAVSSDSAADDRNPFWVDLDAQMPAHAHGMNTVPRREDSGAGHFVFRGLLFHMAGEWEIVLDVAKGRVRDRATLRVTIE